MELDSFSKEENQDKFENSLYRCEGGPSVSYEKLKSILQKIRNYPLLYSDSKLSPNPNYFGMMQPMGF